MKILLLSLFLLISITAFSQCPDGASITANDKCVFLSWNTIPAPLPDPIVVDGTTYTYQSGSGAVGNEAIYRDGTPGGGACSANQSNLFTGQIVVNGQTCTFNNGTLPVELTSFSGEISGHQRVTLYWSTASESNNDKFVVERKLDNLQDWEMIGSVKGAGTTTLSQSYTYNDVLPVVSHLAYYRLKQLDFDGNFEYSDIIVLRNKIKKDNVSVISNPNGMLTVSIGAEENRTVEGIQLFNTLGQRVANVNLNQSLSGSIFHQNIETQGLSTGIYFIQVVFNNGSMASKAVRF